MLSNTRAKILAALLLVLSPLASALSFWDFQHISGFPGACASAYRQTISDCTADDFKQQNPCSSACAVGIQQAANIVNQKCSGVAADPSTLIGLIFNGNAVAALCPSSQSASGPSDSSAPTNIVVTMTSGPSTVASTTTQSAAATSSSFSTTQLTELPAPTTTANPSTTTSASTATPMAATARSSSTANANSFGGDVNPFGSSAATSAVSHSFVAGMALVVAAFLL